MIESNFLICQFRRDAISINNKIFKLQITSSRKISQETDFENYGGAYDWRDNFNTLTFKIFIGTEIS